MKKSLKKAVFEAMDKYDYPTDQQIVDEYGAEPITWQTVETYKTAWKKQKILLLKQA